MKSSGPSRASTARVTTRPAILDEKMKLNRKFRMIKEGPGVQRVSPFSYKRQRPREVNHKQVDTSHCPGQ
jgi:hypothetical protein